MPRQDVPYGGALCRLKERIAEIWDELGKKLHSINGVEGDGAGDVKIVSGDAAIVVTSDQVNHQIEVALDSSQLPAASVSSVNGQTGAVVLDASDINVIGGSDVETDLGNLDADLQQAQTDIAQEALTRANADSTLQGNINTLSASIPTAAATAVANDPTVAQLATDVPNKVDKITSGSSLKAYTHTGATQGETSVVDGTTANSIGIRDANGRMQAADPANGATDKTLTTANWVSQTGDNGPNNLIHKGGDETKNGRLSMTYPGVFTSAIKIVEFSANAANTSTYRLLFKIARSSISNYFRNVSVFTEIGRANVTRGLTYIMLSLHQGNADGINVFNLGRTNSEVIKYAITYDTDYIYLYRKNESNNGITSNSVIVFETMNGDPAKVYPTFTAGTISDDTTTYVGTLIQEVTMS